MRRILVVLLGAAVSVAMLGTGPRHDGGTRATVRPRHSPAPTEPPAASAVPDDGSGVIEPAEPPPSLDGPPLPPRRLPGLVILEDGRPAKGASVWVMFGPTIDECGTETAEDGTFSLDVEPGMYYLRAGVDAEYPHGAAGVTVPEHGPVPEVTIRVERAKRSFVSLRVVEADGQPVPGALVEGERTDAGGRVRLEFPTGPGPRKLTLREEGLLSSSTEVTVETGDRDPGPEQVVELPPRRMLRINVRGPGGEALPPTVIRGVAVYTATDEVPVTRESDGGFTLAYRRWPEQGTRCLLYVVAEGFARWCRTLRDERPEVEVRMQLPGSIAGRLVDEKGEPVAGREVSSSAGTVETDAAGRFRFDGVVPGQHALCVARTVGATGYRMLLHHTEVASGESRDVGNLVLPCLLPVRGRVIDGMGRPVVDATLEPFCGELGRGAEGKTDARGTFAFDLPGSHAWTLKVTRERYSPAYFALGKPGGEPVEVVLLPEGRVRVRTAIPWVAVRAWRGNVRIDAERYGNQIKGLPAGPVRIELLSGGEVRSTREVEVVPGRIVDIDCP